MSIVMIGCTPNHDEALLSKECVTECRVYRTGGASTYYLLKIKGDRIDAEYYQSDLIGKLASVELTSEEYRKFASLFSKVLTQKDHPYAFWKGGKEMALKSGEREIKIALGDVADGVYSVDISNLVEFIYKISPMELTLEGF